MKDKFIKNGVFSLEYDKETLRDMVLELQEENQELKAELQLYQGALKREHEAIHRVNDLKKVIDKAIEYIEEQSKFEKGCDIYRICNKDILLDILKEVEETDTNVGEVE